MAAEDCMKHLTIEQMFHRSQQFKRRMIISGMFLVLCIVILTFTEQPSVWMAGSVFLILLVFNLNAYVKMEKKVEEELEKESRRKTA